MSQAITGKTVVITGAGGVLCSEFARHIARIGGKVALLNRTLSKVEKIAEEIVAEGGIAKPYQVDVLDKAGLKSVHARVLADFGPCDILINGAGGNRDEANTTLEYHEKEIDPALRSFFNLNDEAIQGVFNLNFLGTFLPTQEFTTDMVGREGCCILNVSSMASFNPLTKVLGYSAAKAAVNNLTEWLAVHFSHVGIRVNALAPGFFATAQNKNLLFDKDGNFTARSKKIIDGTPMGRFGVPQDLLGTVQYLIDSNASGFVTGVIIPVDGGFSAYAGV
ncbi:MAG: SDR family oxidoreductase [Sphaerochaetaceae bacterium]|jgi:NAD(P)-dependent dehydrogenase (short-subunit alcohol dehydrogenase family)|nr:SDR family oxidoreductase [Sphaerochaetaceae bacterium]MDD3366575.1 SDR family oxidoreductase [Sphaerochaetaceae bacterium]MDD4219400.1 SDR family oxidoreductase [Sphaerochaetaceae bacterium]MDY0370740.1 SDR family oxidoreductase [Sphaerochaetaceae bacterium]